MVTTSKVSVLAETEPTRRMKVKSLLVTRDHE